MLLIRKLRKLNFCKFYPSKKIVKNSVNPKDIHDKYLRKQNEISNYLT